MRLSADPSHCDYHTLAKSASVFLDGVELVACCLHADEEAGEVLCVVFDQDNKLVYDHATDSVKTEVRRGKVEIRLPS